MSRLQAGTIRKWVMGAGAALLGMAATAQADTYTYNYSGPAFTGSTDHVNVSFTTAAPLSTAKSYLFTSDAGVISGSVTVSGSSGTVFNLPLSTFQLHTNGNASGSVPGIDSWFVVGDVSNLAGTAPTMTGVHVQAYTMNTLQFIPGSDIPGAVGLVTGAYDYDQATQTTFYSSCSGIPGCTLAGNGQPYIGNYSGIINPSNTSAGNWTLVRNVGSGGSPLAVSGTLPDGTVGYAYSSSTLTASGGTPPYNWSASGLPSGLSIDPTTGTVSGTPTLAGTYSAVTVTAVDSAGASATDAMSLVIQTLPINCSGSNAVITGVNKFWLDVNGGLKNGGQSVVYTPTAAGTTFTGGTTTFLPGELVDYSGTLDGAGMCDAATMTVKPAPTYSCTKPPGAKLTQGLGSITRVGTGSIVVGTKTVQTPSCTKVSWNGASGFAVGQKAEYKGYITGTTTVATSIVIN